MLIKWNGDMLQRAREHRLQFHSGNINTSGYTDLGEVPNWLLQTKPKTCESQSQTNKKKIVSGENEDTGSLDDAQEEKKTSNPHSNGRRWGKRNVKLGFFITWKHIC